MKKQRIFGLMAAFAMVLGVCASLVGGLSASAATEQNVTIHKLKFESMPGNVQNTGDEMNETELATNFPESKPLAGAGFTAYDVTTEYWNAYNDATGSFEAKKEAGLAAAKAVDTDKIKDKYLIFDFDLTGDEGTATRSLPITSNGKKAIYKFVETTTPAGVNQTISASFILGLPIYNADNTLKTPVHVYPKNEVKTLDLGFTKYGVDVAGIATTLDGAQFILKDGDSEYYYNSENGKFDKDLAGASKLTSAEGGKVSVPGPGLFKPGIYEFYEIDSDVSKSADQNSLNPLLPEEIFHYKKNPVVTATVAADMTVSYVYYNQQMKETTTGTPKAYNYKVPVPVKTVNDEDVDAGQTVTFTLSQKIPDDVAQYTQFALVDKFDTRLELLSDASTSIVDSLKIDGVAVTDVTAAYTKDSDDQFTVAFTPSQLAKYAGQTLTLNVEMKVKPGTNLTAIKNDLTFDNNFYDKKDSTTIQTYGKRFKKIDNDTRETLEGAEFKITKGSAEAGNLEYLVLKNADGTPILSVTGVVSDKTVDWVTSADDATILISPENGEFGIYGLASGTYTLEETKAPDGYVLIAPFTFTPDNTATELLVANKHKGVLPSTGGTGIVAFVLIGVVALGGAALYFTKGRRQIEG